MHDLLDLLGQGACHEELLDLDGLLAFDFGVTKILNQSIRLLRSLVLVERVGTAEYGARLVRDGQKGI